MKYLDVFYPLHIISSVTVTLYNDRSRFSQHKFEYNYIIIIIYFKRRTEVRPFIFS